MRVAVLLLLALATSAASQTLPAPLYRGYDVFVVAGQSNARGRGDSLRSPVIPPGGGYEALPRGEILPLADPVGGANTGSAWPAFAEAYTAATGVGVIIIGLAESGSFQVWLPGDGPEQTWDVRVEGSLYDRAGPKIHRALNLLAPHIYNARLAGWLWIQGGGDARRIDDGRLTPADYEAGLHALAHKVGVDWGVPMYLFQSGTAVSGDTPGAQAVRQIQAEADTLDDVVVVFTGAVNFPALGWHVDDVHWSQNGLNAAGWEGGAAAAAHRLSLPPASADLPDVVPLPAPPVPSQGLPERPPMEAPFPGPGEEGPLTVRPNPGTDGFTLDAPCAYRFTVSDVRGRLVAAGDGDGTTRLPRLGPGLYVVRLASRDVPADPTCSGHRTLTVVR